MSTNPPSIPNTTTRSTRRTHRSKENEPSEHDKITNDILKHFTTLNTGLLAILAAFSEQFTSLLKSDHAIGTYFLYAFYMSLLFCLLGFMLTVIALRLPNSKWRKSTRIVRDVVILAAALGYIFALMFFITLYSNSLNLFAYIHSLINRLYRNLITVSYMAVFFEKQRIKITLSPPHMASFLFPVKSNEGQNTNGKILS